MNSYRPAYLHFLSCNSLSVHKITPDPTGKFGEVTGRWGGTRVAVWTTVFSRMEKPTGAVGFGGTQSGLLADAEAGKSS